MFKRPDNEYYGYLVNYNKTDKVFEAVNRIGETLSNAVLNILLDDVRDITIEKRCQIENRS